MHLLQFLSRDTLLVPLIDDYLHSLPGGGSWQPAPVDLVCQDNTGRDDSSAHLRNNCNCGTGCGRIHDRWYRKRHRCTLGAFEPPLPLRPSDCVVHHEILDDAEVEVDHCV